MFKQWCIPRFWSSIVKISFCVTYFSQWVPIGFFFIKQEKFDRERDMRELDREKEWWDICRGDTRFNFIPTFIFIMKSCWGICISLLLEDECCDISSSNNSPSLLFHSLLLPHLFPLFHSCLLSIHIHFSFILLLIYITFFLPLSCPYLYLTRFISTQLCLAIVFNPSLPLSILHHVSIYIYPMMGCRGDIEEEDMCMFFWREF